MITLVVDVETRAPIWTPPAAAAIERMAARRETDPASFAQLCPVLAHVAAVGLLHLETDRRMVLLNGTYAPELDDAPAVVRCCETERETLQAANAEIGKAARLITFNGRGFDLPLLVHRTVAHQVRPHRFLLAAANEYRFKPDKHIDLLEAFTFFGAGGKYSLEAYALGYGLANPKAGTDGSQVGELTNAELVAYLVGDLEATAALYRRWRELTQ